MAGIVTMKFMLLVFVFGMPPTALARRTAVNSSSNLQAQAVPDWPDALEVVHKLQKFFVDKGPLHVILFAESALMLNAGRTEVAETYFEKMLLTFFREIDLQNDDALAVVWHFINPARTRALLGDFFDSVASFKIPLCTHCLEHLRSVFYALEDRYPGSDVSQRFIREAQKQVCQCQDQEKPMRGDSRDHLPQQSQSAAVVRALNLSQCETERKNTATMNQNLRVQLQESTKDFSELIGDLETLLHVFFAERLPYRREERITPKIKSCSRSVQKLGEDRDRLLLKRSRLSKILASAQSKVKEAQHRQEHAAESARNETAWRCRFALFETRSEHVELLTEKEQLTSAARVVKHDLAIVDFVQRMVEFMWAYVYTSGALSGPEVACNSVWTLISKNRDELEEDVKELQKDIKDIQSS